MNNQELELKIREILSIENFFDMIEATAEFEKEYKTTGFFKKTKMPLTDVIKSSKAWYALQLKDFGTNLQKLIDNLNLGNITQLLEQLGNLYGQENEDALAIIKEFKSIVG